MTIKEADRNFKEAKKALEDFTRANAMDFTGFCFMTEKEREKYNELYKIYSMAIMDRWQAHNPQ